MWWKCSNPEYTYATPINEKNVSLKAASPRKDKIVRIEGPSTSSKSTGFSTNIFSFLSVTIFQTFCGNTPDFFRRCMKTYRRSELKPLKMKKDGYISYGKIQTNFTFLYIIFSQVKCVYFHRAHTHTHTHTHTHIYIYIYMVGMAAEVVYIYIYIYSQPLSKISSSSLSLTWNHSDPFGQ